MKTIQANLMRDGQVEILDEIQNDSYLMNIANIKRQVTIALNEREQQEISKLKGLDKTLYVRNKVLKIINT